MRTPSYDDVRRLPLTDERAHDTAERLECYADEEGPRGTLAKVKLRELLEETGAMLVRKP